jgi:phage FluMu protein Com
MNQMGHSSLHGVVFIVVVKAFQRNRITRISIYLSSTYLSIIYLSIYLSIKVSYCKELAKVTIDADEAQDLQLANRRKANGIVPC